MNLLDSAIGWLSPETALRRFQARAALDAVRGYDAAQNGRRTASFRRGDGSANASLSRALPVLRDRSRELVRNTFLGSRSLDVLSTHIVSPDLTVRFGLPGGREGEEAKPRSEDVAAQALWDEWVKSCDVEGETTFTGLLTLAVRAQLEGGDSIIRMLDRPLREGRPVPLALYVGEGDLIDESRDAGSLSVAANRARLGVELGSFDERIGYWLHDQVPGEPIRIGRGGLPQSRLVPREQVCHLYRRIRPGQVRGVPAFAPVLMTGRDFADLMDALVVKERMGASIGVIVKSNDTASSIGAAVKGGSGDGSARLEKIRPGMIHYLRQGEEAEAFAPAANSAFEPVSRAALHGFAAGMRLTYHQLTGDLSQANYSSLRAGLLEFRRSIADDQWHMLVPQVLERVVRRFLDRADMAGRLKKPEGGWHWQYVMPAHEPVDPKKDLEADILAVRAGRMSPQDFIGAWGRDWRVVVREFREFFAAIDGPDGPIFDIDARQRTRTGQQITDASAEPVREPDNGDS